ncbi:MAG: PKD domain-containing protein [Candidatus Hydrogenedentes bacterium]|nr:PKD domain-containing protein [Candidatus Hydrogenedentota bacterium]
MLAGCPWKGDNGLALILTPNVLDFGTDEDALTFQVHRNLTNSPAEPVVVSSSQPWIIPELCTENRDNCVGFGPVNRLFVPVRVDRNLMLLGVNRGEIIIRTGGAADQKLTVYAEDLLQVDFTASNRRPDVGQAVNFRDASEKTESAGDVVARLWDFGDGNTSTATDPVHVYATPGLYSVSLTVTTANAEETTRKAAWITVGNPAPTTNFEASRTNIIEGETVTFTNLSVPGAEPITRVVWDFGDGRTSEDLRPIHQYRTAGIYTVSLTVHTANSSQTVTKPNLIVVQRKVAPEARIAVNPSRPIALQQARFSDVSDPGSSPILQWFWDFGDGATSRQQNPAHTYETGGNYEVSLYVVTAHGSDTHTQTVTVVTVPPTASFEISDRTPFVFETVNFTNTSEPGSAPITGYIWEFGDSSAGSTEENPSHSYNIAGQLVVRLTVVTAHGSDTATETINVSFMPPRAEFSASRLDPNVGEPVQFTDQSIAPQSIPINQWLWNFGDPDSGAANMSNSRNPVHTYNAPGFYTVTLTVRTTAPSNNADTIVKTAYINVVQGPAPAFTFNVPNPAAPDVVQFNNMTLQGSEPISSYLWNFGDPNSPNNTSTAQNPTHRFTTAGTFTVTLTAITPAREVSTSQAVTVVFNPPVAGFSVQTNEDEPRENVLEDGALTTDQLQFLNETVPGTETDPALLSYAWNFGDGNSSTQRQPLHQYQNPGTYTVTLTVTTPTNSDTTTREIAVDVPPTPAFSALPRIAPVRSQVQFFDQSDDSNSEPILSRLWTFGDGVVSADENPTHRYLDPGLYNVSLTVEFDHAITGVRFSVTRTENAFIQVNN